LALGASALVTCAVPALSAAASAPVSRADTVHQSSVKHAGGQRAARTTNLTYHGGVGGSGVETGADGVYIVQWGWTADPSGEGARQQAFFQGVGGSTWNNSVTQYCQGVASGTTTCGTSGTHATNPTGAYAGTWADDVNPVPSSITQTALAAEAVRAAAHFGRTAAGSNNTVQYVIDTPKGHSTSGFGTQFCAWHSGTSSSYGNIAYTNFPYMTDAGASCGQNFVNAGAAGLLDGVTIVGGHEFGETETDIIPNSGWLDSSGKENGDKCAWISSSQGKSADITLSTGTFAVQSLWSNTFNSNKGGCVTFYASALDQH
jgi:serine protease